MIEDGLGLLDVVFGALGSGAPGAEWLGIRDKQRGESYLDV